MGGNHTKTITLYFGITMKIRLSLALCIAVGTTYAQNMWNFISVCPSAQTQTLEIPASHTFQVLFQSNDINNGVAIPGALDFTGYVPIANSSRNAHLSINHEAAPGAITHMDISYDSLVRKWNYSGTTNVALASVGGTYRPCSGTVTPWGTVISGEEYLTTGDANGDGYIDAGWLLETDPATKTVVRKIFAAGRGSHENCVIDMAQQNIYFGNDDPTYGCVFKYTLNTTGIDSAGALFALQLNSGGLGTWIAVPNSTIANRNNTYGNALALGATNFNGVEDVEIGPDGKIYFGSKAFGNIYRFADGGSAVNAFDTFVVNTSYSFNSSCGAVTTPWGLGIDNLAFDNHGNLWALQDGDNNYIWMIGSTHTMLTPDVRLFGKIPAGAEPTGITFSPDNQFLFMSIQHPYASNSTVQFDATSNAIYWNRDATIVIALTDNLGPFAPLTAQENAILTLHDDGLCQNVVLSGSADLTNITWLCSNNGGDFKVVQNGGGQYVNCLCSTNALYKVTYSADGRDFTTNTISAECKGIELFPNPCENHFTVKGFNEDLHQLSITDMYGRLVPFTLQQSLVILTPEISGIFFVEVQNKAGVSIARKTLVVL
jgi:uncharacterized protein